MDTLYILSGSVRTALFILAVIFTYYSVRKASLMRGSKGCQVMAGSAIISIVAGASGVMDAFLPAKTGTILFTFSLWIVTLLVYISGDLMVVRSIKRIYQQDSMFRIAWKHPMMVNDLIGSLSLLFLGIPVYILNVVFFKSDQSSWIDVFNTFTWMFGLANLTLAARRSYLSTTEPEREQEQSIMLEDDVLTASVYGTLLNRFILAMGYPVSGLIEEFLFRYFEHNPILFENCGINQDGTINFKPVLRNASRINEENRIQDICVMFSVLASNLLELYSALTSREHVERMLDESYKYIKGTCRQSSVLFDILRSLPEGVLEEEKIVLLPRSELEARVRDRTKELEESRKYINNIIESMNDMLIVVDPDGKIKTINRAVERTLGYSEEEIIGQSIGIIFAERNDTALYESLHDDLVGRFLSQNVERVFLSKDGRRITILFSSSVLYDEHDRIQGIVFLAHDITERKLIENALKVSEVKYRLVVDNANEAIIVAQNGYLKFANPKTMQILGYSEDELTSSPFIDLIHQDDKKMVAEHHQGRLQGENIPSSCVTRIIDKQGSIKWVELNIIPIIWEGRLATLIFMEDVTEKRKMEDDLLRIQKLESVGILAGGIAHDFNNILTGILGNVSLAKMFVAPENKAFGRLTDAEKSCMQATRLTQQLLTFSKGSTPILKLTPIIELLEESANLALRGSNTKCEFSIPTDLWAAEIDVGQISQVISNLIINAEQAMLGGVLNVKAENVMLEEENPFLLKSGKYIKITIEDHGVGIPEENLKRIFDPYFTTKKKGSGLGLTIVYSIVKKHNGQIIVESQIGVGTKFQIYLPASSEKVQARIEELENKIVFGKGKILIMDDEETIRHLAHETLSNVGYEVAVAVDGSEATELYKSAKESGHPFDAVIMDLTVPGGMGGKEAIKRIMEVDPDVKAIVSSGYSADPVMSDFQSYGFKDFIAKPYKISALSTVVHRVITGITGQN